MGDYTAAAIASIAFGLKHPALDGNAIRVLSRLTAEPGNIALGQCESACTTCADLLIDPRRPGEFNQALMELGAVVCLPKEPQCPACPLRQLCAARLQGREKELPLKVPRAESDSSGETTARDPEIQPNPVSGKGLPTAGVWPDFGNCRSLRTFRR